MQECAYLAFLLSCGALASLASVPASVHSMTAGFDVMIYLFYAVAIIGVLFGPLLGLLPMLLPCMASALLASLAGVKMFHQLSFSNAVTILPSLLLCFFQQQLS